MPACASLAAPGFLLQSPLGSEAHLPEGTDPADLAVNGGEELGARMRVRQVFGEQSSASWLFLVLVFLFHRRLLSPATPDPPYQDAGAVLGMFNLLQSQASVFILSSFFFIPV